VAGNYGELGELGWVPNGKLLFTANAGHSDIWIMDVDGNNRRQLTVDSGNNSRPFAPAGGNETYFVSDRTGRQSVWKMNLDGSSPQELTGAAMHFGLNQLLWVSTDGKWIVCEGTSDDYGIWKISAEGGTQSPILLFQPQRELVRDFSVSPDGKMIAYSSVEFTTIRQRLEATTKINVRALEDGKLIKTFEKHLSSVTWSADSRSLNYVNTKDGVSNIWSQPLSGGPAVQLTRFTSDQIFSYAWSSEGKELAVARGTKTSDVVLFRNFR